MMAKRLGVAYTLVGFDSRLIRGECGGEYSSDREPLRNQWGALARTSPAIPGH